ncbi:hypothetical protein [Pedobacter steynii]|uniref:TolB-like 6-blade propeller-like n=1 Tax=Pedobacter steynii TaxID=430522 RepID=A0A1D7QKP6_9SPHI|nr:hypothetical protein [Pedobacter steynii]AOM79220.1 hypothetical protein BFS30_19835 [Pedobacter steynii]
MKITHIALLLISSCLIACQTKEAGNQVDSGEQYQYGLLINAEKGSRTQDRLLWLNSLDSGELIHTDQGIDISNTLGAGVILRDSFLISLDKKTEMLSKYTYRKGLQPAGKLQLKDFNFIENTMDLGQGELYISGRGKTNRDKYLIIDPTQMILKKSDSWPLPVAKDQSRHETFSSYHNGRLYLGYSSFGVDFNHCSDTSYLAILNYPGMDELKITKDTRSAFPGTSINGLFNSFMDEKGDQYILTSPVFYHGNHPTATTAFYKIGNTANAFDKDYFFNLSELLNGLHLLGITAAGNGKVILVSAPVPSTGKSDYYVADVYRKTLTLLLKDQHQPNFIWGTSGFFDGKNAYFIVNEKEHQAQVYRYNSKSNQLNKGLTIRGTVSPGSSYLLFCPKFK